MKIQKNDRIPVISLAKEGLVYLFLFLFLNASFLPLYKILVPTSTVSGVLDMDSDLEKNESEKDAEDAKKLSELSKEYFINNENVTLIKSSKSKKLFYHNSLILTSHYPEKDSPPPKS
jgi:hypothetical protein